VVLKTLGIGKGLDFSRLISQRDERGLVYI
jgi:hypothetical protein